MGVQRSNGSLDAFASATMGQFPGSRHASFASLRSSSISEFMEDFVWPTPSGPAIELSMKIAGVHWWYRTRSHAAELTAGYYNVDGRNGYEPILALCARHGVALTLTCVEMCDAQHPPEALCGPEGLLRQLRELAAASEVPISGENALPCFMPNTIDEIALQRVVYNTQPWGSPLQQGRDTSTESLVDSLAAASARIKHVRKVSGGLGDALVDAAVEGAEGVDYGAVVGGGESGGNLETLGARSAMLPPMRAFTFLRLTPDMASSEEYLEQWRRFMRLMARNGQRFRSSAGWRKNLGFL